MPSSSSSQPRDQTRVSCIADRFFTTEPPGKQLLYNVVLASAVHQSESAGHMYVCLPFGLPSHTGHLSALSRVPCGVHQVLISYLFYTCMLSHSVVSDSAWPHGQWPRLLCPWDFSGKNNEQCGLPFPPPGDLPSPAIEPMSPDSCLGRWILYHWATWETYYFIHSINSVCVCQSQSPKSSHPSPFPFGIHIFVLYICVSIYALHIISCTPFSRFHIYALIYDIFCASHLPWVTLSSTCRWSLVSLGYPLHGTTFYFC